MPIDKNLYLSVIPLKADATKVYSKNSIRQAINENDYIVVDGKTYPKVFVDQYGHLQIPKLVAKKLK